MLNNQDENKVRTSITVRPETQRKVDSVQQQLLSKENIEVSATEIYDVSAQLCCKEAIEDYNNSPLIKKIKEFKQMPQRQTIYWNSRNDTLSICETSSWNPVGHYQTNQRLLIRSPIFGIKRGFFTSFDSFIQARTRKLTGLPPNNPSGRKPTKAVHVNIQGEILDITNQPEMDPINNKELQPVIMDLYGSDQELCDPPIAGNTQIICLLVEYTSGRWQFTGFIS